MAWKRQHKRNKDMNKIVCVIIFFQTPITHLIICQTFSSELFRDVFNLIMVDGETEDLKFSSLSYDMLLIIGETEV